LLRLAAAAINVGPWREPRRWALLSRDTRKGVKWV